MHAPPPATHTPLPCMAPCHAHPPATHAPLASNHARPPPVDRILDTRFWKYYLAPTSLRAVKSSLRLWTISNSYNCFAEKKAGKRKMPAIRSREITYRLCKALKECLCITQALTCIDLQGLPLRDRDLAALAKVKFICNGPVPVSFVCVICRKLV